MSDNKYVMVPVDEFRSMAEFWNRYSILNESAQERLDSTRQEWSAKMADWAIAAAPQPEKPGQPQAQDEREAFEKWFMSGAYGTRPYDLYAEHGLSEDAAFELWQAVSTAQPAQKPEDKAAQQATFNVWQNGMIVASVSGPRDQAHSEANHYAFIYSQDGPCEVKEETPPASTHSADMSKSGGEIDMSEKTMNVAKMLWNMFAPEHHALWADEPHKAEYVEAARAIERALLAKGESK